MDMSIPCDLALFGMIMADPCKDDEVVVRSDFLDHADAREEPQRNEGGGYHPDGNGDGEHGWSSILQSFGGVRHAVLRWLPLFPCLRTVGAECPSSEALKTAAVGRGRAVLSLSGMEAVMAAGERKDEVE